MRCSYLDREPPCEARIMATVHNEIIVEEAEEQVERVPDWVVHFMKRENAGGWAGIAVSRGDAKKEHHGWISLDGNNAPWGDLLERGVPRSALLRIRTDRKEDGS